jgi:hypothetical protein
MNVITTPKLFTIDVLLKSALILSISENTSKFNNFYHKFVDMVKIETKPEKLLDNS